MSTQQINNEPTAVLDLDPTDAKVREMFLTEEHYEAYLKNVEYINSLDTSNEIPS